MSDEVDREATGEEVVERARRGTATWAQPCSNLQMDANNTPASLSTHILNALSRAVSFMESFKPKFMAMMGCSTWEEVIDLTRGVEFGFLNATNGGLTPPDAADENHFDNHLQDAYERMQRLAVGIEEVTLDQALYSGTLLDEFREIETQIVAVLCQLHYAMKHRQVSPSEVITKSLMAAEVRDLDEEHARKIRDAAIVQKYNTTLQHLKEVFLVFERAAQP